MGIVADESLTELHRRYDFHIHSSLSACAAPEMTLPVIITRMAELGFEQVGVVDHVYSRQAIRDLHEKAAAVSAQDTDLTVHVGVELCLLRPGVSTLPVEQLRNADFILLATTHFGVPWVDRPACGSPAEVADYVLDMLESASLLSEVDAIAHPLIVPSLVGPGAVFDGYEEFFDCVDFERLHRIVRNLVRHDIAVEISPRTTSQEVGASLLDFYRMCAEAGLRFCFGSDAHCPAALGMTRGLVDVVSALGLTDAQVWRPSR